MDLSLSLSFYLTFETLIFDVDILVDVTLSPDHLLEVAALQATPDTMIASFTSPAAGRKGRFVHGG